MDTRGFTKKLAVAAVALAALLAATAPAESATSALVVKSYSADGAIVQVTVKNTSSAQVTGTVAVQAMVNGSAVWSLVPVTVCGGQSATVSAGYTGAVTDVLSVGTIYDSGTPI